MEAFTSVGLIVVFLVIFMVFLGIMIFIGMTFNHIDSAVMSMVAYAVIAIVLSMLLSAFILKPEKFGYTKITDITIEEFINE